VDPRRRRINRLRRRQALAPFRLGGHAHGDPDWHGELDRRQSRRFPRRQVAGLQGAHNLLADGCLLVELRAIRDILPILKAQLLSYMKLLNVPLGLLFNFHEVKLADGISRLILPGANQPSTEGNQDNEA
jgi:PD-(D/E)XK nuclease superfamily